MGILSREAQVWLKEQPEVKEETITDWFLYKLSRRCTGIAYKIFTRHQEARYTGADWEWIFVFADGIARLRVQAKKLSSTRDNFPSLARSNNYGQQITKLIDSSERSNAYPLYAFYAGISAPNLCPEKKSSGIFVAGAKLIDADLVSKRTRIDVGVALERSLPIECLACCPKAGDSSALAFVEQIGQRFGQSDARSGTLGFEERAPAAIRSVVENEFRFPEWWENEFRDFTDDVRALMIVDNRPIGRRNRPSSG